MRTPQCKSFVFSHCVIQWLILLLHVFGLVCLSVAAEKTAYKRIQYQTDGVTYVYSFDESMAVSESEWDMQSDSLPPLSREKASEAAWNELKQYGITPLSHWVKSSALVRYDGTTNVWYYLISFIKHEQEPHLGVGPVPVIVMMSGDVPQSNLADVLRRSKTMSKDVTVQNAYEYHYNGVKPIDKYHKRIVYSEFEESTYSAAIDVNRLSDVMANERIIIEDSNAASIAINELAKYVTEPQRYFIQSIKLHRWAVNEKWIYVVIFRRNGQTIGSAQTQSIYVLSDGTPISLSKKRSFNH